jgi:hypothetical protein
MSCFCHAMEPCPVQFGFCVPSQTAMCIGCILSCTGGMHAAASSVVLNLYSTMSQDVILCVGCVCFRARGV